MNGKEKVTEIKDLVFVFSLFVVGTISLFIVDIFWEINIDFSTFPKNILLLVSLYSYELVLLSIFFHYFRVFEEHFKNNKKGYTIFFLIIILVSYSIIGFFENKWIGFGKNLFYGMIVLIGVPIVKWLLEQITKQNPSSLTTPTP